jgi:hypothetical protein
MLFRIIFFGGDILTAFVLTESSLIILFLITLGCLTINLTGGRPSINDRSFHVPTPVNGQISILFHYMLKDIDFF